MLTPKTASTADGGGPYRTPAAIPLRVGDRVLVHNRYLVGAPRIGVLEQDFGGARVFVFFGLPPGSWSYVEAVDRDRLEKARTCA